MSEAAFATRRAQYWEQSPRDKLGPARRRAVREAIRQGRPVAAARILETSIAQSHLTNDVWEWLSQLGSHEVTIPAALSLARKGYVTQAAEILALLDHRSASLEQLREIGSALHHGGRHGEAKAVLEDLLSRRNIGTDLYPEPLRRRDNRIVELSALYLTANAHVADCPVPGGPDVAGFVLIYNIQNPTLTGVMATMVGPLGDRGYACAALLTGTLRTPPTAIAGFDSLQGCLTVDGQSFTAEPVRSPAREWTVDWTNQLVEAEGINFFPYFAERLAQRARRYRADVLDDPASARRFLVLRRQADVALDVCERLIPLAAQGCPVRIAIADPHFAPQGIFREWCIQVGHQYGIHAVALGVGYENYFSNLSSLEASTLAVEDLTAQPELRQPFLGGAHRLSAYLAEHPEEDADPDEQVLAWINQDRSKIAASSPARRSVAKRAADVRSRGGKIFVILGKVSIDFAAPGDRGFAHDDFVSWIDHLVTAVAHTENLLLIKPHPHELREEIVVGGVELLRDLVAAELPANVVFLDHDSFNTHELSELVDTAFVWNGTAVLEFTILNVPVVAASVWAGRDYPIGLEVLRSREEYEDVLSGSSKLQVTQSARRRAANLLRLMHSDHVAIPYRYIRRPATNLSIGTPKLDAGALATLRESPDPHVDRAASRFFEFAEVRL